MKIIERDESGEIEFSIDTDTIQSQEVPYSPRDSRVRPVPAGVESGTGQHATSGPLAIVTDTDSGTWGPDVESGDVVRVRPAHAHVDLGEPVYQPYHVDISNFVGYICGWSPASDGDASDIAVRTSNMDQFLSDGVRRDVSDFRGEEVVSVSGQSGTTRATVLATNADVVVPYNGNRITLTRQIVTEKMTREGDSGSPLYDQDGNLVGMCIAGSETVSVFNRIDGIESELGIEVVTDDV